MKMRNEWLEASTFRPSGLEKSEKLAAQEKDERSTGL
jgi:hypothetical protein